MSSPSAAMETSTNTQASPEDTSMTSMDVIYITVTTVSSSLSVVGCLVIIGVHVAYRNLRTTGRAMLVQLSVADMLTALGNLLGVMWYLFRDSDVLNRSTVYCSIQSAWTIFSSIASFLWTIAIALALCWAIVSNMPTTADRHWTLFMIVCWGTPAVVTTVALSCKVLGYDPNLHQASWCWIDPDAPNPLFWTFFTGKAWELCAYVLTIILYSVIKVSLCRHKAQNQALPCKGGRSRRDVIQEANAKLTFVPLVFIVLRVWGTTRFLLGFFDYSYASSSAASWIVPMQGFGDSAQGFANFVIYCFFTRNVRRRLFRCCRGSQVDASTLDGNIPFPSFRAAGPSSIQVTSPANDAVNVAGEVGPQCQDGGDLQL